MNPSLDFVHSNLSEPHRIRTKKILKAHPEMRTLISKNPYTLYIIIGIVLLQVGMAWLLAAASWWWVVIAAYAIGAFADHALFVMIHECAHHLLFKSRAANRWAGILANLPQLFPSSISFERYHIKHHSFQGVYELDADLPNHWEARLIKNHFVGKALWLLFYPFFQLFRISRLREIKPFDKWVFFNVACQAIFIAGILLVLGPKALVYLLLSFFFSVGLHPLGARWIQEHYLTNGEEQETYSYYGPLNVVAFNVGYHNEHHDFPSVPWNKLPAIREKAPDYYNTLSFHKSWTRLFLRFLFDPKISLFSRIIRKERGRVPLTDISVPDRDLSQQSEPPATREPALQGTIGQP
jgi:sphingolipid 4-desaturase/C4-monooxygenase